MGYRKSIGGRLGKWEKAKGGLEVGGADLWDCIKVK